MWTLKTIKQRLCTVARRDKTLPRIQNTSQNPKHFPGFKTLPKNQKQVPESKNSSQNPKHVFLGRVFGFWEVFWILGRVFGF